jgi:hypothetical protein
MEDLPPTENNIEADLPPAYPSWTWYAVDIECWKFHMEYAVSIRNLWMASQHQYGIKNN